MMLSRVADCLYWMSRYLERAEHTARALDVQLNVALDESPWASSMGWMCLLGSLRVDLPMDVCSDPQAVTDALVFDRSNPSSVVSCVRNARENARQVRESITSELWEEINHLHLSMRSQSIDQLWSAGPHGFLKSIHRGSQMITGIIDATFNHGEGWQFIRLGRYLERAMATAWMLDSHFGMRGTGAAAEPNPDEFVAWSALLRMSNSYEPYCKIHTVELRPQWILQFLLLNPGLPRSIRFAAEQIQAAATAITIATGATNAAEIRRLTGRLAADLSYVTINEILSDDLSKYLHAIVNRCVEIHNAVYNRFVTYTVDAALAAVSTQS